MTLSGVRKFVYVYCIVNVLGLLGYMAAVLTLPIDTNHLIMTLLSTGVWVPIGVFKMFELSVGGYEEDK